MKNFRTIALFTVIFVILGGFAVAENEKILKVDVGMLPDSLDPVADMNYASWTVLANIGGTLFGLNQDNEISFELAESVKRSKKDKRCYEIKIKDNLTFHDGSPLTAYEVAFSIKRAGRLAEESEIRSLIDHRSTKALDAKTVQVCSKNENDFFLYSLSLPVSSIVSPKHVYENKKGFRNNKPIMAGFYKIEKMTKDTIQLRIHENHPYVKRYPKAPQEIIMYHYENHIPAASSIYRERMKEGKVNFLVDNGGNFSDYLKNSDSNQYNKLALSMNNTHFMTINNAEHSRLKDTKIRNALAAAVHRYYDSKPFKETPSNKRAYQLFPESFLGQIQNPPVQRVEDYEDIYKKLRKAPIHLKFVLSDSDKGSTSKYVFDFFKYYEQYGFIMKPVYLSKEEALRQTREKKGYDLRMYFIPFISGDPTTIFRIDFLEKFVALYDPKRKVRKLIEDSKKFLEQSLIIPIYHSGPVYWTTKDFRLEKVNTRTAEINFWEVEVL